MGCVSSKGFETGGNRFKKQGSKKFPVFYGFLGGKKNISRQIQNNKLLEQVPRNILYEVPSSNVTLGNMLEEDGKNHPEVINVVELMEGLSEEDDPSFPGSKNESTSSRQSLITVVNRVVEDTNSLSSSSEYPVNNEESPRSPLNFDKQRRKFTPRYGLARNTTLDTVVTTTTNSTTIRTFSFKLKSSSNDQVSTPKLILDSSSPLVKSPRQGMSSPGFVVPNDATSMEMEDEELLSTFENILEQLSSDDWLSTRASNAESFDPESPTSPTEQEITLYFLRNQENHQDCCTLRSILKIYGIGQVEEMDISTHPDYKQELVHLIDELLPAAVFINGRFIGGAEQLLELHKRGRLGLILNCAAKKCNGCGGLDFIPCLDCNGSRKFVTEKGKLQNCTECLETGSIRCPLCS